MTIDEFLEELEKLKDVKWEFQDVTRIRCSKGYCPIEALATSRGYHHSWATAGYILGLQFRHVIEIVNAADIGGSPTQLRARLLKVVGLQDAPNPS